MDTLTHTLTGWTIGRCFPEERRGRWVVPVSLVAANLPDVEYFFRPFGDKPFFLLHHRGWSHSFLGILLEVVAFSAVSFVALRWLSRVSGRIGRPRFTSVLLLISVQAYTHLFLDWWNTYGVRPFYPFSSTWYYGDLVFIIDPWIWLMLGTVLAIGSHSRWRTKSAQTAVRAFLPRLLRFLPVVFWLLLAIGCSAVTVIAGIGRIVPHTTVWLWFTLLPAAMVLVRWAFASWSARRAAAVGLVGVSCYVVLLGFWGRSATAVALDEIAARSASSVQTSSNPIPAIPWRREVIVATPAMIHQVSVDAFSRKVLRMVTRPRNLDAIELGGIGDTPEFAAWKSFARHPVVERVPGALILGDARYQLFGQRTDWSAMKVRVK